MTHSKFKGITLCTLAALFAAGQAFAHTGVRDQVEEGKASYNGFTITHGCGDVTNTGDDTTADQYPVIGQVALFPYGGDAVWRDSSGALISEGGNGNGTISSATLSLSVTGYAGYSSPFATSQEIVDSTGIVHALLWKDGVMEPKQNAITPFKITAPTIANNCVKSLKIRVGVINYCDVGKNADTDIKGPYVAPKNALNKPISRVFSHGINNNVQINVSDASPYKNMPKGNGDNNRADWWFYNLLGGSTLYSDPDLTTEGVSLWSAAITVNNSAVDLAKCAGTPVDVTVEPSGPAFDTYLTEKNTRPFSKGNSNL